MSLEKIFSLYVENMMTINASVKLALKHSNKNKNIIMNEYQSILYDQLMSLTILNKSFYYDDFNIDDTIYRIFNYRICTYEDFLLPGALQCRGIMFEVSNNAIDALPIRVASFPIDKFFNLNENPSTTNIDLSEVEEITLKEDGSLISTYVHNGELRLKSKGSLSSEQAIDSMKYLNEHDWLKRELSILTTNNLTVNMEYTSQHNRVVVGYQEVKLTILNVRCNKTGKYKDIISVSTYPYVVFHYSKKHIHAEPQDKFIESIYEIEGIEGYVARMERGQLIKIKTKWYMERHHSKNIITSRRRLFEAVVDEQIDDLRSMFFDDQLALDEIEKMENFVINILNESMCVVNKFYEDNKILDRKTYAIKGQKEVDKPLFGLIMSAYQLKKPDYKKFLKKNYKTFGVTYEQIQTQ